jgi:hypothetical protein
MAGSVSGWELDDLIEGEVEAAGAKLVEAGSGCRAEGGDFAQGLAGGGIELKGGPMAGEGFAEREGELFGSMAEGGGKVHWRLSSSMRECRPLRR